MRTDTQKFIDALANFKKAAQELSKQWTELGDDEIAQAPNTLYPFRGSFDDVASDITEWVDDSIPRIKYTENLKKYEQE